LIYILEPTFTTYIHTIEQKKITIYKFRKLILILSLGGQITIHNRNKAKYFVTIVRRSRSSGFSVKCGTAGKPFTGGIRGWGGNRNTQKGGNCYKINEASESHSIQFIEQDEIEKGS
jgi:hypothetical protein